MRVVVLTELKGGLDDEAPALATLLGVSAYDVRARLSGELPRVVLQTADDARAVRVQAELVARGHGVVVRDAASAVSSSQMVRLHRFALEAGGVWANDGAGEFLAWGDLGVVVLALVRAQVARTTEEVELVGRGARRPVAIKRDVTRNEHALSHAAFLFPHPRAGARLPWLLEEATAQFLSLGEAMQPTRRGNFFATVARIRRFAPRALVDDRYVTSPLVSASTVKVRGAESGAVGLAGVPVELTVQVLAEWLTRDRSGPYRG